MAQAPTPTNRPQQQAADEAMEPPINGVPFIDDLSAEEQAAFDEMRSNSGPDAQIVQDDGAEASQADADAAAAAAAAAQAQPDGAAPQAPAAPGDGQPQAAAGEDDDDADEDPTQNGKFPQRVSYHKFKRTQDRLKAAETKANEAAEKLARTDERIKMLIEAMGTPGPTAQQPNQQADPSDIGPMPDPEKDIFAFAAWQAKAIEQLKQQVQTVTTDITGSREQASLMRNYQSDIQTFKGQNPDFDNAYQFMLASRASELAVQRFGVDLTEEGAQLTAEQFQWIKAVIENEEQQLATIAIQNKQSPARQLYLMAKTRGYRAPAGGAAPAAGAPAAGSPAALPNSGEPAPAPAPKSALSQAVAAAKQGVATNQSLSSGGGAPDGELTREQVFAMSEEDFDRFMNTASKDQIKAVLGA
jgi:hypothetical protein